MKKFLIIGIVLFALFDFNIQAQDVHVQLQDKEIKIGEQTTLDWELSCSITEKDLILPQLKDTISKFIQIVDISEVDTTFDEEEIETKIYRQRITITSWDSGFHVIPPLTFKIGDKTFETEALLLSVTTIPIEANQDIKDIKAIIDVPFSFVEWIKENKWTILLILLGILLIAVSIYLYLKYRNRPQLEFAPLVPKEAADSLALRKLADLKSKKLWQASKVKLYYIELSHIVREYIENRYQLNALELTTDETMALVKHSTDVQEKLGQDLEQMLMLADMAKFAKQLPMASENEASLKFAFRFVEETKYIEEKIEEEEESNTITDNVKLSTNA